MKYVMIIALIMVCSCSNTRRAGGFYNPDLYQKMLAQSQHSSGVKKGIAQQSYHSALGNLCTSYKNNDGETLICNDGKTEKQVRILQ